MSTEITGTQDVEIDQLAGGAVGMSTEGVAELAGRLCDGLGALTAQLRIVTGQLKGFPLEHITTSLEADRKELVDTYRS